MRLEIIWRVLDHGKEFGFHYKYHDNSLAMENGSGTLITTSIEMRKLRRRASFMGKEDFSLRNKSMALKVKNGD